MRGPAQAHISKVQVSKALSEQLRPAGGAEWPVPPPAASPPQDFLAHVAGREPAVAVLSSTEAAAVHTSIPVANPPPPPPSLLPPSRPVDSAFPALAPAAVCLSAFIYVH